MELRQAILMAADLFDRMPGLFNFDRVSVPSCGSPGCAIGWIEHFLGVPSWQPIGSRMHGYQFYERISNLTNSNIKYTPGGTVKNWGEWTKDAAMCARGLRLYADKYHPETVKLPDWNALAMQPLPVAERTAQV